MSMGTEQAMREEKMGESWERWADRKLEDAMDLIERLAQDLQDWADEAEAGGSDATVTIQLIEEAEAFLK